MSQASQFAMEGVKNLVVKKHVSCYLHMYISHQTFRDYIYFAVISCFSCIRVLVVIAK